MKRTTKQNNNLKYLLLVKQDESIAHPSTSVKFNSSILLKRVPSLHVSDKSIFYRNSLESWSENPNIEVPYR